MNMAISPNCKTKIWPDYNVALKEYGSVTIWIDPITRLNPRPPGKRGQTNTAKEPSEIQANLCVKTATGS